MTIEGPGSGGDGAVPTAPPGEPAIAPDAGGRIESMVARFVDVIASLDVHSGEYRRRVDEIDRLGEREIVATSQMSNRMLARPVGAADGILEGRAPLARTLADLRRTVEDLNPARYDLAEVGARRFLGIVPLRDRLEAYFDRYGRARTRIEEIVAALAVGRSELERDNARIAQEQRALATETETLRQYAFMAQRLDEELERRLAAIEAADPERGQVLRSDVLFAVRRRRQEILTQLAVATQGYLALGIVERNNAEVIRAISTATTTTVAALRTAVAVAQAAASRRLVTRQVAAVRELANGVTETASAMLRDSADSGTPIRGPGAGIGAGIGADLVALQRAWDGVFAALDRIEASKETALAAAKATAQELPEPATQPGDRQPP